MQDHFLAGVDFGGKGIWAGACLWERVTREGKFSVTWADEIGSWEDCGDEGEGFTL